MDDNISIMSLNCQGLNNLKKRRDMFHFLRSKKYSIYFVQDTHFEQKMENYILAEWGYQGFFSSYTSNSRGVAILFNNNFEFKVKKIIKDQAGNYIILLVEIHKENYLLVNIYGPNRDNPEFYNNLRKKIRELNVERVIIAGDFNLVLDPKIDYHNYKHINNTKAKEAVHAMIEDLDLNDIWRDLNPEYTRFTWRRSNPFQQARLDFFLISDLVVSLVNDVDIKCGYRTDHSGILLKLKLFENVKHNTFWKFNSSLLKDKNYLDEINNEINAVKDEYLIKSNADDMLADEEIQFSVSDDIFLDFLLMKIRAKTISYATMKKRKTAEEEKSLEYDIIRLERVGYTCEDDLKVIEAKKQQLKVIREKRMEGVLLRSRARWVAEGEKISSYFCNLEKRHYVSKNMSRLIDKHNNVLTNQNDVLQEVHDFYKSLYREKDVEQCEIKDLVKNIQTLSEQEAKELEGKITLEEATDVLKNMKNNKSPGSDGFTVEFFKVFWKKLGVFVIRAINESFRKGEMSTVQREGIITCIPKGDKPREYVKNWRPISLLNVIYKIGSSCIANRIKCILPKIINEDQSGFIRNRYIGDNIRLIYDVIAYLDEYSLPGLLLNIDFEKAFDSVNWTFMIKVLKAFGFQNNICHWITTFYRNLKSCVVVNGQISNWFQINRGCRQGDPISPYLFILVVEILAIMVRENSEIKGIVINDTEHKLSQYADDTEFLLEGDRRSFETCINVIGKFSNVSGLFMNSSKTSVIWLGSMKNSNIRYLSHLGMAWNPKKFKILGVWFTNDLEECVVLNLSDKLNEIRQLFKIWIKRQLTPLGRIAILKSLILSKLTYLWLLLPNPPDDIVKTLQQMCYNFVWCKKTDKISRKIAHKSIKNGGIGFPDIKTFVMSLKLSWMRKTESSKHKWKLIFLKNFPQWNMIRQYGPEYMLKFTNHNKFWNDVFDAYRNFFYKCVPSQSADLFAEPLFYNDRFQVGNKYIVCKKVEDRDIYFVGQFFQDNGNFISYAQFKNKYNVNVDFLSFMGYKSVIRAFVQRHHIDITDNKSRDRSLCFKNLCSTFKGSRLYYDILIENNTVSKSCMSWNLKLPSIPDWKSCFLYTHKIQDIKLKWFQLRILHRCLGTNVILKEMGVRNDDTCSFCGVYKDKIEHMFWYCTLVERFWTGLISLFKEKCNNALNVKLTLLLILLGHDEGIHTDTVFDFIILFAKFYIYSCKMDASIPQLSVFLKKLNARFKIEEYNARMCFDYLDFSIKWANYKSLF